MSFENHFYSHCDYCDYCDYRTFEYICPVCNKRESDDELPEKSYPIYDGKTIRFKCNCGAILLLSEDEIGNLIVEPAYKIIKKENGVIILDLENVKREVWC